MGRLGQHFAILLAGAAADSGARLSELPLLGGPERQQLLAEWSGGSTEYPRESPVDALFAAQAAATPETVAAVCGAEALTYRELNRRANRLAHRLGAFGVSPEIRVGLCLERSLDWLVACLAILKAGGAYVPLDPTYPRERLALLAAGAPVLVTEERWLPVIPQGARVLCLDREMSTLSEEGEGDPASGTTAENLAYVMFTSGSTGLPKGVAVRHRGVVRLVRGTEYADFGSQQVFLQLAALSFDASTLEIWGPLLNGGRLVVPPPGRISLVELGELLARHGVTTLWLTAGLFQQMVTENLEGLRPVRQLLAGGDVLSVPQVRRMLSELPDTCLINGYGPTESTTFACCFSVEGTRSLGLSVPLGRPIANTDAYVVDRALQLVSIGLPGELMIGGDGLARGYLERPELTAERFVPSAFGNPGSRLYRTGDLVRWAAGGHLEFLGRIDAQVKVRGFRIEPGEIEATLGLHPRVLKSVVVVREDQPGDRRLVAYVVGRQEAGDLSPILRAYAAERLPAYLVPAAFVVLADLPLTPNGKVARAALPRPEWESEAAYVAPRTPVEEMLAGIWGVVLGVERVGLDDDFFGLGGHSLLATQVMSRVREAFDVELPLRALFEAPTISGLSREVESALAGRPRTAVPPLRAAERRGPLPLSFAQERLWFLDQLDPGSAAYNIPVVLRLLGSLDVAVLQASLAEIVRRHEALRTTFPLLEGRPEQVVTPTPVLAFARIDLTAVPPESGAGELQRLALVEAGRPFDLARGPLLRIGLVRLAADEHAVLFTLHHIVSDGWSMEVLVRELGALYGSRAEGRPSPLPELALQYPDFALWQRDYLAGGVLEGELAYWKDALAGLVTLDLPADRPRPPARKGHGAIMTFGLPAGLTSELKRLSRAGGSTLFMSLLAGFTALLSRCTGQDDIAVGTPIANRDRAEIEGLIGFFANTLVLRIGAAGDPTFGELLTAVRRTALGAYEHQGVPFERVVEELSPPRDPSRTPLFQVMFTLQNPGRQGTVLPGLTLKTVPPAGATAKFDLTLSLGDGPAGLSGSWEYDRDLFAAATVARLSQHFETLLTGAVRDRGVQLSELPLLSPAERHQLLQEWNGAPGRSSGELRSRSCSRPEPSQCSEHRR